MVRGVGRSVVSRDRWRRWSLVAVGAAVLVALPTVVAALPRLAAPVEPGRLRELIMRSDGQPHQGYVESTGLLGVPDLPNLTQVTALVNGTNRIRTWYDSPSQWRYDVLSAFGGEHDVYHIPDGEYVWDYGTNLLTLTPAQQTVTLDGQTVIVGEPQNVRIPRAGDLLPPDLARRVLAAAPGDPVEALPSLRVAGLSAAGLRIRPADPDTSIGQVDIWADPASGLPVRVEVTARGAASPVLVTQFVDLSLDRPAPDVFAPTKPPDGGFTVVTRTSDLAQALITAQPVVLPPSLAGRGLLTAQLAGVRGVGQYGTGLSSFVVLPLPRNVGGSVIDAARKAAATDLTLPGGTGVRLTVAPVTVVVERSTVSRRTYLLAGLVSPTVLERAAAELSIAPRSGQ